MIEAKKTKGKRKGALARPERIKQAIVVVRGQRVILASDLAAMYGVSVKQLNQAVKRNAKRFPKDFIFQLSKGEAGAVSRPQNVTLNRTEDLKSQIVTSSWGGARRALPYAFTEHGAVMAANVLRSERAVKVSVFVVRAFVKLREVFSAHRELAGKLGELERKLAGHDDDIQALIHAVRDLMEEPDDEGKPRIGYQTEGGG